MRHIPIDRLLKKMQSDTDGKSIIARLAKAHTKLFKMPPGTRQTQIRDNGPNKWSPVKVWFTEQLGTKCWYTETEVIGVDLSIDHYRPICKYWWLAFSAENYRVACAFSNSPKHNQLHGRSGGKGDAFPLLPPARRAVWRLKNRRERPILLDPCNKRDCDLIAFDALGRPVVHPDCASDPISRKRVEESMLLLNLDHPDFNSKREQLRSDIAGEVLTINALPQGSPPRTFNIDRLKLRLSERAPFSSAARYYLQLHKYLPWVEDLLIEVK